MEEIFNDINGLLIAVTGLCTAISGVLGVFLKMKHDAAKQLRHVIDKSDTANHEFHELAAREGLKFAAKELLKIVKK